MKRHISTKKHIALAAACITAVCLCGCTEAKNSAVGFCLDTVVTLTGYCNEALLENTIELCKYYEQSMSKTIPGSDVWRINHSAGMPTEVSADTAAAIAISLDIAEASGGALDITIAPSVSLWDFTTEEPALPDAAALAEAAKLTDYTKITQSGNTVALPGNMEIDLGAVAKGYIGDKCVEYLVDNGVKSAMLNLGGNVIAIGSKPDGSPWVVGIQDPTKDTGEPMASIEVIDKAVVTSGIYQRGFELGGKRYHHILDPKNGCPVDNGLAGVTIIADSSALGDALSTACFILGADDGIALAERYGAEAVFVARDGSVVCTPGLEGRLTFI